MKRTFTIAAALALTGACSSTASLKPIDYADAGTTAAIIAQGGLETNPLIGAAGNAAAPVVALGVKYGLRAGLPALGMPQEQADAAIDVASWIGTCNNIPVWLNIIEFPKSLIVGAVCGGLSLYMDREVLR